MIASVVPERIHELLFNERIHILSERELSVLFYCLMNVTVNSFILAYVNDTLSQLIFVQLSARFHQNREQHGGGDSRDM